MKKLTVLTIVLTLAFSLAAFGSTNASVEKGAKILLGGHDWIVLDVVDGDVSVYINDINGTVAGVRPALWLNLESF